MLNKEIYQEAVNSPVDKEEYRNILLKLKPSTYVGLAEMLAKKGEL